MARRVKLSVAKKAVDSTLRRILNYTAEIIMSIILLVIICIPLAFVVPMWFQTILLGRPRANVALDPVRWFGLDGATWITLLLGIVSFVLGYVYILRLKPGITSEDSVEELVEEYEEEEAEEEPEMEDVGEEEEPEMEDGSEVITEIQNDTEESLEEDLDDDVSTEVDDEINEED
ncbi:MAG: hypothetical protein ACFFCX_01270 [Candidatus Sifarchaeia archaeon]